MDTIDTDPPKQRSDTQIAILDAASRAFSSFGYQKTSLDDVATDAGVSRQAIYVNFTNKRTLFQAAFEHELETNLRHASHALQTHSMASTALVEAFAIWHGQYIARGKRLRREGAAPPVQPSSSTFQLRRARFVALITSYIEECEDVQMPERAEVTSSDITRTLLATSRGIASFANDEAEFRQDFDIAIRALLNLPPQSKGHRK